MIQPDRISTFDLNEWTRELVAHATRLCDALDAEKLTPIEQVAVLGAALSAIFARMTPWDRERHASMHCETIIETIHSGPAVAGSA